MRLGLAQLGWLGALYFAQGLPFGFQATALPVYLRSQGVSVTTIGFLGVLAAPWLLKPLWAPLIDRYGSARWGRRKSWIVPLQAALALVAALAAATRVPDQLGALLVLIFLLNALAATQDIAVDGLAVDTLRPEQLGPGNAVQVVGYKLGMLVGGGLLVWLSQFTGWSGLFLAMAGLYVLVLVASLLAREAASEPREPVPRVGRVLELLWRSLSSSGSARLLLFVGSYKLGESMSDVVYKPFLVDAGISPARIGLWVGTWGLGASIVGSLAGGALALRFTPVSALAIAATLRIVPLLGRYGLARLGVSDEAVIAVTLAEELCGGALTTALFALMMSRVVARIGASHYALLSSVEVLGKAPAGPFGGLLIGAAHASYASVFLLGALLSVAFALCLPWLATDSPQKVSANPK